MATLPGWLRWRLISAIQARHVTAAMASYIQLIAIDRYTYIHTIFYIDGWATYVMRRLPTPPPMPPAKRRRQVTARLRQATAQLQQGFDEGCQLSASLLAEGQFTFSHHSFSLILLSISSSALCFLFISSYAYSFIYSISFSSKVTPLSSMDTHRYFISS